MPSWDVGCVSWVAVWFTPFSPSSCRVVVVGVGGLGHSDGVTPRSPSPGWADGMDLLVAVAHVRREASCCPALSPDAAVAAPVLQLVTGDLPGDPGASYRQCRPRCSCSAGTGDCWGVARCLVLALQIFDTFSKLKKFAFF